MVAAILQSFLLPQTYSKTLNNTPEHKEVPQNLLGLVGNDWDFESVLLREGK